MLSPHRTPARAQAEAQKWRHGLSLFGELKYPAGFKHFDYVNPEAPKGGTVRQIAFGTFDNFNLVVAGVKGTLAAGVDLLYDTLMVAALDEVSTEYGLLAEAVSHPDGFFLRHLSAARRGEVARRQAGHAGRRRSSRFEAFKKHQPAAIRLTTVMS